MLVPKYRQHSPGLACVAAGPRTRLNHLYTDGVWSVCHTGNPGQARSSKFVSHTIPVGVEFFSYDNAADHVSENAVQARKLFLNDQWRAV